LTGIDVGERRELLAQKWSALVACARITEAHKIFDRQMRMRELSQVIERFQHIHPIAAHGALPVDLHLAQGTYLVPVSLSHPEKFFPEPLQFQQKPAFDS
jgi:hypothetical protein